MIEIARISSDAALASSVSLDSANTSPFDRWSYHSSAPTHLLRCDSRTHLTTLRDATGELRRWADPLEALAWLGAQSTEPPTDGPPFKSGWIGYLSYNVGRLFETLPSRALPDLHLPLFAFTHHDHTIAVDHAHRIAYDCRIRGMGFQPMSFLPSYEFSSLAPASNFTRPAYESAVRRAIEYIAAGDIFQVNLSQRFTAGLPSPPRALYDRLRTLYPARFGAYLDFGDHALLCNSPELFLRVTCHGRPAGAVGPGIAEHTPPTVRHILTRPIKGTRPRLPGMDTELLRSPKDRAELAMIVDLERNDLGRICEIGSVKVTEPRVIEPHPTIYHGAASIEGVLRPNVSFVDLLRATFPGGSVTGAPKIRAMQIIDELEPNRRGPYCGAIGYLSADGNMQFNIAIRTMIARKDQVHFSVGGGIVADSDPAAEYEETLVKAKAMLAALGA